MLQPRTPSMKSVHDDRGMLDDGDDGDGDAATAADKASLYSDDASRGGDASSFYTARSSAGSSRGSGASGHGGGGDLYDGSDDNVRAPLLDAASQRYDSGDESEIVAAQERDIETRLAEQGPPGMRWIYVCGFFGGMGPLLAWNSIYLSETVFGHYFGDQFLSTIGLCQNVPSLALLFALIAAERRGLVRRLGYARVVLPCYTAQCAVTLGFVLLLRFGDLRASYARTVVYAMIIVNGVATGLGSGRCFALAAEFPARVTSFMIAGAGAGALLPAAVGLAAQYMFKQPTMAAEFARPDDLLYTFSVSAGMIVLCAINLASWTKQPLYASLVAQKDRLVNSIAERDGNEHVPPIVHDPATGREYEVPQWSLLDRHFRRIWALAATAFYCMVVSLATLSLAGVVPFFTQLGVRLSFYLISLYFLGDLVGRQLATLPSRDVPPRALYVFAALRSVFLVVTVWFSARPFVHHDAFMCLVFFLLAATNGAALVCTASNAQSFCGFSREDTCPIVGSIIAAAIQLGLVAGVVLSFAMYPLIAHLSNDHGPDWRDG